MSKISTRLVVTLLLLGFSASAFASSVFLVPTTNTSFLTDGNIISFDVVIDFTDEGTTLGGGLDIAFDSNAVSFSSLNRAAVGDPAFSRDPDNLGDLLESWAIGDFDGVGAVTIGNVQFEVLPTMGSSTVVTINGTNGVAGPWVSGVDFLSFLTPSYNQVLLSRGGGQEILKDGFEDQDL